MPFLFLYERTPMLSITDLNSFHHHMLKSHHPDEETPATPRSSLRQWRKLDLIRSSNQSPKPRLLNKSTLLLNLLHQVSGIRTSEPEAIYK